MKAFKKISLGVVTFSLFTFFTTSSYNSMVMNSDSFMADTSGIAFTKRLDEINGKVVIGRMAASSIPWTKVSKKAQRKIKKAKKAIAKSNFKKAERKMRKAAKAVVAQTNIMPKPAINADMDLKLSNVFHKKPLKAGTFSGSAKTVDGVIEEIFVSLPDGKQIEINTRERMAGNVFQYEDTETREMKSGMFYEVKKGTYMITLTNDSQFAGTRLEFKAGETEVAYNDDYYSAQENWDMDQQNQAKNENSEQVESVQDKRQDIAPEESYDQLQDNNFNQENEFVENNYEQNPVENDFNFQS